MYTLTIQVQSVKQVSDLLHEVNRHVPIEWKYGMYTVKGNNRRSPYFLISYKPRTEEGILKFGNLPPGLLFEVAVVIHDQRISFELVQIDGTAKNNSTKTN